MSAENKALVRRLFKEVWSKGKLDLLDKIVAADYENHDPAGRMPASGREGLKQHVTAYRDAFPDLAFTIDDILADGNKVIVRWTANGTHLGTLLGAIPATGRQVLTIGTSIIRVAGGKITEQWANWDALGLMQQLGVTATPGAGQTARSAG